MAKKKRFGKLKMPEISISKDKEGDTHVESYREWKRQEPSPEEKRHDTGEKDYNYKKLIKGKSGNVKHEKKFSRRGNTQESSTKSKRDVSSKNEDASSSWKSKAKVVESGPKRRITVESSNKGVKPSTQWVSEKHSVTGEQESKSKRTKYTGQNKPKKYKAKLRKVKSDQPSYKKLYGDMLG